MHWGWTALAAVGLVELALRAARWWRGGAAPWTAWRSSRPRVLSFESHPYALYVKRPNNPGAYPSNNLGYAGSRSCEPAKRPGAVRIYCVGGSTTETHDPAAGPDSSWPGRLQDLLARRFAGVPIEVINAGTAGYTSAESLAEFLFRGVDLRPDLLVVYHNVNDAWTCQMVEGFKSDYSHARLHKRWDVGWINRLPELPWLAAYQVVREWVARRFGKANALIYWIADPPWKTARALTPQMAAAFVRNIRHLVVVAQHWGCLPVLLKWECDWAAHRLPNYLEQHPQSREAYFELLRANNASLRRVADECPPCEYLEPGPFEPEHFCDTLHFSSAGLELMARRVAEGLEPVIRRLLAARQSTAHAAPVPAGLAQERGA